MCNWKKKLEEKQKVILSSITKRPLEIISSFLVCSRSKVFPSQLKKYDFWKENNSNWLQRKTKHPRFLSMAYITFHLEYFTKTKTDFLRKLTRGNLTSEIHSKYLVFKRCHPGTFMSVVKQKLCRLFSSVLETWQTTGLGGGFKTEQLDFFHLSGWI